MKIIVNPHKLEFKTKDLVNELEIDISKCEFEFADEITNDYVKEAYFTSDGNTYKKIIENNECFIPIEALEKRGMVEIGVVAFKVEGETEIKRYNPSPIYFNSLIGSLKEATNTEPITPTDKEQIEQELLNITTQMNNLDIEAEKEEHTTTITITKKDGTEQVVEILDGEKGDKGDKGEPGAIKMIIVAELPATGSEDTIYLVPLQSPESQENNYAEYVYINGNWELLGKIGIQVDLTDYYTKQETYSKGEVDNLIPDLTDYVKNTDYATASKGGVVKIGYNGTGFDSNYRLKAETLNFETYSSQQGSYFIGKGTLENVITGKGLVNKTYVDGLVGDINTALDTINGEVI